MCSFQCLDRGAIKIKKNEKCSSNENLFNDTYITNNLLNPAKKNLFQRRIIGLVSYYSGATKDLFAGKKFIYKNLLMDTYHKDVYEHYEYIEEQMEKKNAK